MVCIWRLIWFCCCVWVFNFRVDFHLGLFSWVFCFGFGFVSVCLFEIGLWMFICIWVFVLDRLFGLELDGLLWWLGLVICGDFGSDSCGFGVLYCWLLLCWICYWFSVNLLIWVCLVVWILNLVLFAINWFRILMLVVFTYCDLLV